MNKTYKLEAILWSIAFLGFGQLLNGHLIKGILFILLEFTINVMNSFNQAIMFSFLGKIMEAARVVNYVFICMPCMMLINLQKGQILGYHLSHLLLEPILSR
jgi:TM2 domain-containing membrane protein YozV